MTRTWRTSSHSTPGGNCAEAAGDWRKATHSMNSGNCAEAAAGGRVVLVRDTRDRGGVTLCFPEAAWRAFTAALRGNHADTTRTSG
jgi:hypothetical protein